MTRLFALLILAACGSSPEAAPAAKAPAAKAAAKAPAKAADAGAAVAMVGMAAPDFTLPDLEGKAVHLSDFKDKVVVLEWFNPGCPFVVDTHGREEALGALASTWGGKEVVWLAINSGGPGKQGHGVEANKKGKEQWKLDHPVLLDESGKVGRQYGAKTTPHMYVIDPAGTLAYIGAIDNAPLGKISSGTYTNFVDMGLQSLTGGQPIATPKTKPYGCSVKYGS